MSLSAAICLSCRPEREGQASMHILVNSTSPLQRCSPANQEGESELEEVERELGSKQAKASSKGGLNGDAGKKPGVLGRLKKLLPPIFLEAFVLTFLAEWGDRSQVLPTPQFCPVSRALEPSCSACPMSAALAQ